MWKIIKLLAAVAVFVIGWWLLSPLFINKEVDDDIDPRVESALDMALNKAGEGLQKVGEAISSTKTKDLQDKISEMRDRSSDDATNLEEQITDEEMMNEYMEEMAKMEDTKMQENQPPADGFQLLANGMFQSVAHEGSGDVHIFTTGGADSETIVRFENFDVLNGPDLRVLVSKNTDIRSSDDLGDYIELGELKGNKGNQNYVVPDDVDINEYRSVVIYCKPFHVVFNSANLDAS
jgi:hypothetical protein